MEEKWKMNKALEKVCSRNEQFKKAYLGLQELWFIHKEERDTSKVPEILGVILGNLIIIETNLNGYEDHENHLKDGGKEENE